MRPPRAQNVTVGPPSALATYEKDSPTIGCRCRFDADDKQLISVREAWNDGIQQAFLNLPKFTWETPGNNQTTRQPANSRPAEASTPIRPISRLHPPGQLPLAVEFPG